jgi:hypothetical protein
MSDKQATQEAQLLLNQLLFGKQMTYCLSGVARLGVADHMNATPMAVEEIAGKTGAHAPSLYRVMRMLASMGVFKEEQGKRFALTARGRAAQIRHPGTMRYFAMMFGDEWTTRAYEHFTDCLRTGQDGVSKAYGQHVFDLLAERPEQSDTFQAAMTSSSTMVGKAVTGAYDFSGIKRLAEAFATRQGVPPVRLRCKSATKVCCCSAMWSFTPRPPDQQSGFRCLKPQSNQCHRLP